MKYFSKADKFYSLSARKTIKSPRNCLASGGLSLFRFPNFLGVKDEGEQPSGELFLAVMMVPAMVAVMVRSMVPSPALIGVLRLTWPVGLGCSLPAEPVVVMIGHLCFPFGFIEGQAALQVFAK